jgi:predicted RNA-binding Zn ribbon-like protein
MSGPAGPKLVGGRLCLDFVNTVSGRRRGRPLRERLLSYGDLVDWARRAGALSGAEAARLRRAAATRARAAVSALARARRLREALYRTLRARLRGLPPARSALRALNAELAEARAHQRLVPRGAGFAWEWPRGQGDLGRAIWPLARSGAELLSSPDLDRVRQCGGEACGWMFVDATRNGSRRWCDMRDCGNVAKVRRFRERARGRGHGGAARGEEG